MTNTWGTARWGEATWQEPASREVVTAWFEKADEGLTEPLTIIGEAFTKSNETVFSRVYERLTKASRRRVETRKEEHFFPLDSIKQESAYRQAVYDTLAALQQELS